MEGQISSQPERGCSPVCLLAFPQTHCANVIFLPPVGWWVETFFRMQKGGEINQPSSHYKVAPFYFLFFSFLFFSNSFTFYFFFSLTFLSHSAPFLVMSLVIRLPLSHFLRGNLPNILSSLHNFQFKDGLLLERIIVIFYQFKGFSENSPGLESVHVLLQSNTIFSLLQWIWLKSLVKAISNFFVSKSKVI